MEFLLAYIHQTYRQSNVKTHEKNKINDCALLKIMIFAYLCFVVFFFFCFDAANSILIMYTNSGI